MPSSPGKMVMCSPKSQKDNNSACALGLAPAWDFDGSPGEVKFCEVEKILEDLSDGDQHDS